MIPASRLGIPCNIRYRTPSFPAPRLEFADWDCVIWISGRETSPWSIKRPSRTETQITFLFRRRFAAGLSQTSSTFPQLRTYLRLVNLDLWNGRTLRGSPSVLIGLLVSADLSRHDPRLTPIGKARFQPFVPHSPSSIWIVANLEVKQSLSRR